MKFFRFFIICVLLSPGVNAQVDRDQQPTGEAPGLRINNSRLYGKLVDSKTGKGIEAASVQLYLYQNDSLIAGMLTKPNGDFSFEDVEAQDSLKIIITAIGYDSVERMIESNKEGRSTNFERDLGNIALQLKTKELGNVTVVSNRPALELGIDRKVYNVSKSLVSTGSTGIDVIRNIPSVSVDIDGNVTLRNSPPQIFIDGRPTILTLDQIPSENIEKVELITNPSAKFDAASAGGIINIVLKKNKRVGLNGIVSASVGAPRVAGGNLNLNLRQGKFNFFLSGSLNQFGGKAKTTANRINKSDGIVEDYFNQYTTNDRLRRFQSIRLGADYFIDNRNTLTITQDFGKGSFQNDELQDQEYLDSAGIVEYFGRRTADAHSIFRRNSTRLGYKHNFLQAGRELTADITFSQGSNDENSGIINEFFYPDGSEYKPSSVVRNDGNADNKQLTFQADYIHPINEYTKFEAGARSFHNASKSYFNAYDVNSGFETKLPLSNNYEYDEMVNALYFTYSGKRKTFSYQLGLRAEHSKFDGLLVDSALKFGYEYPSKLENAWDALFPSVFFTKQLTEKDQLQLNYSRRIRRPGFWQLNPFIDINDPVNLRQGNPQLRPEFINSFELNYSRDYEKGNFLAQLYFANNPDDITQFSDTISTELYNQLQDAGVAPNAILNTFINAGTTNRYGAEFTLQHRQNKNFNIISSVDFQYRTVQASTGEIDLSNKGLSWEASLTADYKIESKATSLLNNLGFQLNGEYESSEVIPQGRRTPEYRLDLAVRKEFLKKNKASLTFAVNDVFNTQRWGTIYDTETFYQESYRRWNVRNFRVTFSYKFGKADFSLANRNNRGGGDDD
jgi:outer membrane receptor protein involved in Fe transport